MEEMVLIPKSKYDRLINPQTQSPQETGGFEAIIAPISVGQPGHLAFNSNAGLIKEKLHDPLYPGALLFEGLEAKVIKFEPHVVGLVKRDFFGVNPFQDYSETISFYAPLELSEEDEPTIWDHHGIFAWPNIQKKDQWLSKMIEYTTKTEAESEGSLKLGPSPATPLTVKSTYSSDGSRDAESRYTFLENLRINGTGNGLTNGKPARSVDANALGLMLYDGNIKFDFRLVNQFQMMLPKKRVIWLLVKRYFRVLYAFTPIVDEFEFREATTNIIGFESYEEIDVKVKVDSRLDLVHLALLMVVLRFSYVTLFSNRKNANEAILTSNDPALQELKYLFNNPIDMNSIEICYLCLYQMLFFKIVNIPVIQLAMLLRSYNCYAPEEGIGLSGTDTQILNHLVVQMGYSLGLHRDPSNTPGILSERRTHFVRKVWIHLILCDIFQGYRFGNPISTNVNFFDTKFPSVLDGNENVADIELDRAVTKILSLSSCMFEGAMKQTIDLSLNVRQPIYLSHFTSLVNLMETMALAALGRLRDYLGALEINNAAYSYGKSMKCSVLMSLEIFYITVLVHLTGYYKEKGNAPLYAYYFKKTLFYAIDEVLVIIPSFVTKLEELFGDGVAIILNPLIIDSLFRVNDILISSLMQCNNYLYKKIISPEHQLRLDSDPDYHTHFQKLSELVVLLEKFSKLCVVAESIMSSRYYLAWKVFKSHQSFLRTLNEPRFYEHSNVDPEASSTGGPQNFTSAQLQEIIEVLRISLLFLAKQIANNSEEFSVDEVTNKNSRNDIPSILRNNFGRHTEERSVPPYEFKVQLQPPELMQASPGMTPFDISNMLDLDLFMLEGMNGFNNNEVDSLWLQMTNLKMQKRKNLDELTWQSIYDGTY